MMWYIVQMSGIGVALFTNHWVVKDEFHMGVLNNCAFNTSGCYRGADIEGNLLCDPREARSSTTSESLESRKRKRYDIILYVR